MELMLYLLRLGRKSSEIERKLHELRAAEILELGHLIKSKQITSEEFAKIFLDRLKRYGPVLESVITITEELAYEQARRAEQGTLGRLRNTPLRQLDQLPAHQLAWFPFLNLGGEI